jgi:redox-sensitive bicupin YhaK (pirin superfamily)
MLTVRRSHERGHADHGWLKSQHTFSFAGYHDPQWMGWGNLRVINEDRIAPHAGFGTHGHRDMEIVSVVLSGALAHRDSMNNGTVIHPGEVQRMSAGQGVQHSEFNHAADAVTHFLQIWVEPDRLGASPGYAQQAFDPANQEGRLCPVLSPDGTDGALTWNADARLYVTRLDGEQAVTLPLAPGRKGWVQVLGGAVCVNGNALRAGDAVGLADEKQIHLDRGQGAQALVFDLAP